MTITTITQANEAYLILEYSTGFIHNFTLQHPFFDTCWRTENQSHNAFRYFCWSQSFWVVLSSTCTEHHRWLLKVKATATISAIVPLPSDNFAVVPDKTCDNGIGSFVLWNQYELVFTPYNSLSISPFCIDKYLCNTPGIHMYKRLDPITYFEPRYDTF